MRSGDDDAGVGAQAAGDVRDPGRGHRANEQNVHTHREDAGGKGILKHIARKPRVFAQDNLVPAPPTGLAFEGLEDMAGGAAEFECRFRGDRLDVRCSANAVGAEDFPGGAHGVKNFIGREGR